MVLTILLIYTPYIYIVGEKFYYVCLVYGWLISGSKSFSCKMTGFAIVQKLLFLLGNVTPLSLVNISGSDSVVAVGG